MLSRRCTLAVPILAACELAPGRPASAGGGDLRREPPRRTALRGDVVGCYAVTDTAGRPRWPGLPLLRLDSAAADHGAPGVWRVRVPLDAAPGWLDSPWYTWAADADGDSVRVGTPYGLGATVTVFAGAGRPSNGRTASFDDTDGPPVEVGPVRVARVPCPEPSAGT